MTASPTTYKAQLVRLSRIQGQLRGVRKMIADGRYCLEITMQIEAVSGALQRIQWDLINDRVRAAAIEARHLGDALPLQRCIGELLRVSARDGAAQPASGPSRRSGTKPHPLLPSRGTPIDEATS